MCGGSGGGGNGGRKGGGGAGTNGDAGQPGEVVRQANQMLENMRSGKLSQRDAEAAADAMLTASMKSRNFDETRALNKKYTAMMDAIDTYKAERGTLKTIKEKTNQEIYKERYGKRDRDLAKKIFGNKPVGSRY
jgi:predicted thioredoxin/glutaredoxin